MILCKHCSLNSIEDEKDFLINCELQNDTRLSVFGEIIIEDGFRTLISDDKMTVFIQNNPHRCAKFIVKSYLIT